MGNLDLPDLIVANLMSVSVQTTLATEKIRDVRRDMRLSRIRHMPVLDEDQRVAGIISDRDILLGWSRGADTRVADVMSRNLHSVRPDTSAADAASRMLRYKIGCLPVLDENGKLAGIITETDFLEIAHRVLSEATDAPTLADAT